MKYFAYGSNTSQKRIQKRIAGAKFISRAVLNGYALEFHKDSKDDSGKCDAYYTQNKNDNVWGVLYEISAADKEKLDRIEGLGKCYTCKNVSVQNGEGEFIEAFTYCAMAESIVKEAAKKTPYCWYKYHVLTGAKESGFPAEYTAKIEAVKAKPDPDINRAKKETDIYK